MEKKGDGVRKMSVSLYGEDLAGFRQVAKDVGLPGISAAIRYVRRDWERMKRQEFEEQKHGQPQRAS